MSKLFRMFFKPYEEDDVASIVHNGIGYSGVDFDLWHGEPAKIKHRGVGYDGMYDGMYDE